MCPSLDPSPRHIPSSPFFPAMFPKCPPFAISRLLAIEEEKLSDAGVEARKSIPPPPTTSVPIYERYGPSRFHPCDVLHPPCSATSYQHPKPASRLLPSLSRTAPSLSANLSPSTAQPYPNHTSIAASDPRPPSSLITRVTVSARRIFSRIARTYYIHTYLPPLGRPFRIPVSLHSHYAPRPPTHHTLVVVPSTRTHTPSVTARSAVVSVVVSSQRAYVYHMHRFLVSAPILRRAGVNSVTRSREKNTFF